MAAVKMNTPAALLGESVATSGLGGSGQTYGPLGTTVNVQPVDIPLFLSLGFVLSGVPQFVSTEQTGTGSAQAIAHGLGGVPSKSIAYLTGGPAAYAQPSIVAGANDATNVNLTVTSGWKFIVIAWA